MVRYIQETLRLCPLSEIHVDVLKLREVLQSNGCIKPSFIPCFLGLSDGRAFSMEHRAQVHLPASLSVSLFITVSPADGWLLILPSVSPQSPRCP